MTRVTARSPVSAVALGVFVTSTLSASSAWGQVAGGLLPATGLAGGTGDLRSTIQQLLPNAPSSDVGRAWTVNGSLGVQVGVTDNPGGTGRSTIDGTTLITPELYVSGDTRRATVRLGYSPAIILYANSSNQNRISQNLNASATAVVVPETLFLDVRGIVTEESRFGSNQAIASQQNSQFLSKQDAVQTTSFSISPYAVHRFGGWGTARVGYQLSRTLQDSGNGFNQFNNNVNTSGNLQGFGTVGNLTTNQEEASFVTGENFGRFNNALSVQALQYGGGTSLYKGSYRNTVNNTFGAAVSRAVTLLASVGYQDIQYGGGSNATGLRLSEPTWNLGTRLTPNADSSITVLYGRHDGDTSLSFDGSYSPTPRTRIYGSYSNALTSSLEEQQGLLSSTGVGAGGLLVDSRTGAPVTAGSAFGNQNTLSRVKRLTFTALLLLNRDSFSASITNEDRTSVSASTNVLGTAIPSGTNGTSTTGSVSWQHDLNPATSLSSVVSYGVANNAGFFGNVSGGDQNTFSASTSLGHTFTETLSGSVSYSFVERSGGAVNNLPSSYGGNGTQNIFLVGLRKNF